MSSTELFKVSKLSSCSNRFEPSRNFVIAQFGKNQMAKLEDMCGSALNYWRMMLM